MAGEPITVSIRREVDAAHISEASVWAQEGVNLASRYPGFLGSGWVRAGSESTVWHMLYRFAGEETLDAWEQSPEREHWLSTGEGFVRSERVRRRTGIEGWFDEPATGSVPVTDAAASASGRGGRGRGAGGDGSGDADLPPAPPRWKQAVAIWLGFFPLNLAFSLVMSLVPPWDSVPLVARVLIMTLVLTPVMTYWVLPLVTRLLRRWLAPSPVASVE